MRKTLTAVATLFVLAALFAGSWYVTGMLRKDDGVTSPVTIPGDTTIPDDATSSGSTQDDSTGTSAPATTQGPGATQDTANIEFPLPKDLVELNTYLRVVMFKFGANEFAVNRVGVYATAAYFDTLNAPGSRAFIATSTAGQGAAQAILASGAVIAALLDNPEVTELIDAWGGEDISPTASQIASAVVAFAQNDGYAATAGEKAPPYAGELSWKVGGSRHGDVDGYEPGYGRTRSVLLDLDRCPVPAAPLARILSERAELTGVDTTTAAPAIPRTDKFALLTSLYLGRLADFDRSRWPQAGQVATLMYHDALIATWRANWANGVAAPVDVFNENDPLLLSSYPSYPAWTEVAVSATERYVSELTGRPTTIEAMLAQVSENFGDSAPMTALFGELSNDIASTRSNTYHWAVDREVGRELGACIAAQALQTLRR